MHHFSATWNVYNRALQNDRTRNSRAAGNTAAGNRIAKDSHQRDALYNAIINLCAPFSLPASTSACLLNIATGRAASKVTKENLTERIVSGHKRHAEFRNKCTQDEERILQPIKKRKVSNFAQENLKKRQKQGETSR